MTMVPEQDQALARTTAACLDAAAALRGWHLLALGLTAWLLFRVEGAWLLSAVTMLLGLWLCVLHARLLLDARILRDFANGQLQPETFDQHLVQLGLARPPAGRSMAQRCAGAMRLWRWLLLATLCQLFWLLAMLAWLRPAA